MQTRRNALILGTIGLSSLTTAASAWAQSNGQFRGRVLTEWLDDARRMRLVEPFEYIDPSNVRWPVPRGTVVDGASIPQIFWSLIGSPFEGYYRNASVVHDFYCSTRIRPHVRVHRMFYDAMIASGVSTARAWLMYQAVDGFGPRWRARNIHPQCELVDENYDFEKCALNDAIPPLEYPLQTQINLLEFIRRMEGQADVDDLRKLRDIAQTIR